MYFIILNFMASLIIFIFVHEAYHYITFMPYSKSICLDLDNEDTLAHVYVEYPNNASIEVFEPMRVYNELWAGAFGILAASIFFVFNMIAFHKPLERWD